MTTTLWLDLETRSRCDLPGRGVYNYVQDPSTEVLCMSYALRENRPAYGYVWWLG